MKKLATKLLVALGLLTSGGVMAQTSGAIGITTALDETAKTIGKRTLHTLDNLEVSLVSSAKVTPYTNINDSKNRKVYLNKTEYTAKAKSDADLWKKAATNTTPNAYSPDLSFGFQVKIASGYRLNISEVYARLLVDVTNQWKVVIIDEAGDVRYESSDQTTTTESAAVVDAKNLSLEKLTGEIKVLVYVIPETTKNKYIVTDKFTIQGTLEEVVQTQYNKPIITIGDYDVNTGTYPVTMETSDVDGVISYKVGDEAYTKYTEAISVAPNTTITAKVTGKSFNDSEEASKTTGAMPTLAAPTATVTGYNFAANTYSVTLAGPAGATIKYSTDSWTTSNVYSEAIAVASGATLKAKAEQKNMNASADLSYVVAKAPVGGSAKTPEDSKYVSNVEYNLGAITVPGPCIAGPNSSGNSSIAGSIKTRTNQALTAISGNGFYINVNPGYTVTSITVKGLSNNRAGAATCSAVYVDGDATNVLAAPVELPYASAKSVAAVDITVSDIQAKERIEFAFEEGYQAQMTITVDYIFSGDITLNNGFATLSAPQNFTVTNGTAYKAQISASNLVLTKVEGVIPANDGVVVVGEKGANVTVEYVADAATADMTNNDLKGTSVRTKTSELKGTAAYLMVLDKNSSTFGSYTGEYFPANKAYVLINGANGIKALSIVFGDESTATGIRAVNTQKENKVTEGTKCIINGQIVIKTQEGYMNLMGVRVK